MITRITKKAIKPSPLQVYELRGVSRYVYRVRVGGIVTRSGVTRNPERIS
jgi:hypothetical protein